MMTRAETKRRTRDALLLAALELFAESGLEGPSLDAICERAGRTRGAFYVHFADRDALVSAVTERVLEEYVESLGRAPSASATIEQFAALLVGAAADDPELPPFARLGTRNFRLVLDAAARLEPARASFERILAGAVALLERRLAADQREQRVRQALEPGGTAELLVAVLLGLLAFPVGGEARVARVRGALMALLAP